MNRGLLIKGIKKLSLALVFVFSGPVILYSAFKNESHPWFYYVLAIGFLFFILAIFLIFKGVGFISSSFFEKED